jgi:hypothetical protein
MFFQMPESIAKGKWLYCFLEVGCQLKNLSDFKPLPSSFGNKNHIDVTSFSNATYE